VSVGLIGIGLLAGLSRWDVLLEAGAVHTGLVAVGFGLLAWVTLTTQADNRTIWALAWAALFGALSAAGNAAIVLWGRASFPVFTVETAYALSPADLPVPLTIAMQFAFWAWLPTFFLALTLGLLLFPDGRPPSPRWRWVGWYSVAMIGLNVAFSAWLARPSSTITLGASEASGIAGELVELTTVLAMVGVPLSIAALVVRYRRSAGAVRRQIRWIGWGSTFLAAAIVWTFAVEGTAAASSSPVVALVAEGVLILAFAVAITKYRLYDIDVVISRTVAYASLAVVIAGLYVAAVFGLVALFGDADRGLGDLGAGFWFGATALVAIVFEPLRVRLQRWANRVAYGQRAAPHEVLSQLTSRLSDSSRTKGLIGLAELLRQGTGAESALVWLRVGDRLQAAAVSPAESQPSVSDIEIEDKLPSSELELSVSVRHGGELLGALSITKPRSHPVTPADEILLSDVAAGAGLLLRNLRLNAELATRAIELQASRRRLIAAQDAARHRLERDLHDGAQQQVVALKVRLGLAKTIAEREGAVDVAERVAGLADDTQQAVDAMRMVARGIYPPLLDAEGLGPALAAMHRAVDLSLQIDLGTLPRYSKEAEQTVYFCILAAVTQAEMAGATAANVDVHGDDASLTVTVIYDSAAGPSDLAALTDRVDAFGGTITTETVTEETALTLTLPVTAEVMEPA
jgi:signal transduction histidine kinase